MKLIMTFFISCIVISSLSAAALSGNVADAMTGENLIGANISFYKNGILQTGISTDIDGEYYSKHLDPGIYDVKFSYVGYEPLTIEGVLLTAWEEKELMAELSQGVSLAEIVVTQYKIPVINQCHWTQCGLSRRHKDDKIKLNEEVEDRLSVSCYPNPTTDLLNVFLPKSAESIIVRSMDGKELLQRFNLSEGIVELDLSNYSAGAYVLQVFIEGKMITKKVMVVRK